MFFVFGSNSAHSVPCLLRTPKSQQSLATWDRIAETRFLKDHWPTTGQITAASIAEPAAARADIGVFGYAELASRTRHIILEYFRSARCIPGIGQIPATLR